MDPIDRQEVLTETGKWLNDLLEDDSAKDIRVGIRMVRVYMKEMPSVQPERKTGRWIGTTEDWRQQIVWWKCSECGMDVSTQYKYCPDCGAEMRGEKDD